MPDYGSSSYWVFLNSYLKAWTVFSINFSLGWEIFYRRRALRLVSRLLIFREVLNAILTNEAICRARNSYSGVWKFRLCSKSNYGIFHDDLTHSHSFTGLGKAIHSRGFSNITNIDASPVVISQMADLHSDLEEMECKNSHSSCMKLNICTSYYIE